MSYHYTESGLDHVWLENGFRIETHPNYGDLIAFDNVRGLHEAIGRWLIAQPRRLTGGEFRFLRTEMDISQRVAGEMLGVTEQAVAKWERARDKNVANVAADRLMRYFFLRYFDRESEFGATVDRLANLDADRAASELRLTNAGRGWEQAA